MRVSQVHELRTKDCKAIAAERIEYAWRWLLPFFGKDDIADITVEKIDRYVRQRTVVNEAAIGTVIRELGELRAAIRYAAKIGKIVFVPWIPMPPAPPPKDRWMTLEEVQHLIDHADARTELFIRIAYATGQRRGVIERLRWDQIDWARKTIDFRKDRRDSKKRGSVVPMTHELYETLRDAHRKMVSGWVLGEMTEVTKGFQRARAAADLEDVTPHTLRHTAISHLVMSGMPLLDVAAFVGVSLRTIASTYAHFAVDHLREQAEGVLKIG